MTDKKLGAGKVYSGPMTFANPPDVDQSAFYAMEKDGKSLKLKDGEPIRLVHIDLAPNDPEDGKQEFRVAAPHDPPHLVGNTVELEPDTTQGAGDLGTAGGN